MNDKDKKNKDEITFSDKDKDGKKITYKVKKMETEKSYMANDEKTKKSFKNVKGNDWFYASAEWKSAEDKDWKTKREPKMGFWISLAAFLLLLLGGIAAFVLKRNKKKSLDEEKFL